MTSDSDRIIDLYQRRANDWDAERGRSLFERPWLDRFLALLPSGATILDLGCGSAEPIARYFIESGVRVVGADSASALIAIAARRFPQHTWIVADMRLLDLDARFDGLIAWDSFFHLCPDDQRRMFSVFSRHLEPHGALMFTSGPADGEVIGHFRGEPLYHASLGKAEYELLLDGHGFDVVSHVAEDPQCGGHTIWLARRRQLPGA